MAVALAEYALCTRAEANSYLGYTDAEDATRDDKVSDLINRVSALIITRLGRYPKTRTYTSEEYSGEGHDTLFLTNYPVQSVDSICEVQSDGTVDDAVDSSQYRVGKSTGMVVRTDGSTWSKGFNNWQVTYVGGYKAANETPSFEDTMALDLLRQACVKEVSLRYVKDNTAPSTSLIDGAQQSSGPTGGSPGTDELAPIVCAMVDKLRPVRIG